MINLRYHIVSLVAVFLALAIGVIAGTTVVDQGVVAALEAQSNGLRAARDEARAESADLGERLDVWERFGELLAPERYERVLAGTSIVLVTMGEVPDDLRASVEGAIVRAEASITGRIGLTDRWLLPSEQDVRALARAIGARDATRPAAATQLGRRLGRPQAVGPDLLGRLAAERFLTLDGIGDRRFPARDAIVVLLSAITPEHGPDAEEVAEPLARAIASTRSVAVVEAMAADPSLVDRVRRDAVLRRRVATVDHADTTPGAFSLVAALADLRRGAIAPHYGTRGGATAVAPS